MNKNAPRVSIAERPIGPSHPPYIIAEMSANHGGEITRAFALMTAAKEAGADAVKLQTYTADTLTIDHDGPDFRIEGGPWANRTLYDLYQEAHTPWEWHEALFAKGRELGITVFSSPFDESAIELLESLEAPAYKIASFEAVDLDLVECAARTGKPIIISTGMADVDEISEAVETVHAAGNNDLVLLHCVSGYPTPVADSNLRTLGDLVQRFECVAGLSDHSRGIASAVAAVALGASVIEKHFTLRRADGGPDSTFSLEPNELQMLVANCRDAWVAIGEVDYTRKPSERPNAVFRRSLYVVKPIAVGEVLTAENIRSIRPGYGLKPKHFSDVLGLRAKVALPRGTALSWDAIE